MNDHALDDGYYDHMLPEFDDGYEAAPDLLPPARVEAMAREYCRIMGLDADEQVNPYDESRRNLWQHYAEDAREFIAMQFAYERTK